MRGNIIASVVFFALALGHVSAQSVVVGATHMNDTIYWYIGAPVAIPMVAAPAGARISVTPNATVESIEPSAGRYSLTLTDPVEGVNEICITAQSEGGTVIDCVWIVVEQPAMSRPIDRWPALRATVGRKYNPSSEWKSLAIPAMHYQTVVEGSGKKIFDRPGYSFREGELPEHLIVTEAMKDLRTSVYWKPNGTPDRSRWVLLAATYAGSTAAVTLERRTFEAAYRAPEHIEGFEFNWTLAPKSMSIDFDPLVLIQDIGNHRRIGVQASASCPDCEEFGITPRLVQGDETRWTLTMTVDDPSRLTPDINSRRFDILIEMKGRGGARGLSVVTATIWYDPTQWHHPTSNAGVEHDQGGEAGEVIRSLDPFKGKNVAIFQVEGELRNAVVRRMEAGDSTTILYIENLCSVLYSEPLSDCFNTMLQLASSARTRHGKNPEAMKVALAKRYGIDPEEIDDVVLMEALDQLLGLIDRREDRPILFYLVTSQEQRPRIIGLVMADGVSLFGSGIVIRETITGSALQREIDLIGMNDLSRLLPSAMLHEEKELQMIWPEEKAADR